VLSMPVDLCAGSEYASPTTTHVMSFREVPMATMKTQGTKGRLVWRISERAPMGEWVDPAAHVDDQTLPPNLPEVSSGGWVISSFDLLHGTDITEDDTIPGDLLDELFPMELPTIRKDS
jgi:hypothetical protein